MWYRQSRIDPLTTDYPLTQVIGKVLANVYQALSARALKGPVLIEQVGTKTYRAVTPGVLLTKLQQEFEWRRNQARTALEPLEASKSDDRLYQLQTPGQLIERAKAMVEHAGEVVLFDLFPGPLEQLSPQLEQAAARGVKVIGLIYGPDPARTFKCVASTSPGLVAERWPGQQLGLVVDAREHLVSLLSHDGQTVKHGIWSDSRYLSCLKHSGLAAEIRIATMDGDDIHNDISLLYTYPAGLRDLIGQKPHNIS